MAEYKRNADRCQVERPRRGRVHRVARSAALAGAAAGALLAAGSFALAYFGTHPVRLPLWRSPAGEGMPSEDVEFASRDGLRLSGWFVPARGARAVVVLCHGHPFNRCEMLFWARMLWPRYHLLLFDFRAMGRSGGNTCTIGHEETRDLIGAVDYLARRPETRGLPVGVVGLSMGGAAALMAAAEDPRIRAVATHGAYARLDRAIAQRGRVVLGPLGPALSRPATLVGRRWLGVDPCDVAPVKAIERIAPRPVLLMHGERDRIISPEDGRLLARAGGPTAELWEVPGSGHQRVAPGARAEYSRRLNAFLVRALGEPAANRSP
ncbi:MAG: alpha/beta fold hydrolase [Chthonomonadales bacterium]|nr:alpha/beta fold hydrolase [Chthonomonadales bacterium]